LKRFAAAFFRKCHTLCKHLNLSFEYHKKHRLKYSVPLYFRRYPFFRLTSSFVLQVLSSYKFFRLTSSFVLQILFRQIFMYPLRCRFSCTHGKNYRCRARNGVSACKYARLGGLSVFFLCNDTLPAIGIQPACRR